MLSLISSLILLLTPFILINYPKGLIFLGDLGAYSLGLIVSMITIILFGRHAEISPWGAVLILIYPVTEVLFSILRRIVKRVSIFSPDREHLHIKLFNFLRLQQKTKNLASGLATPTLTVLWIFPIIAIPLSFDKLILIWIFIVMFIIFYSLIYFTVNYLEQKYLCAKK